MSERYCSATIWPIARNRSMNCFWMSGAYFFSPLANFPKGVMSMPMPSWRSVLGTLRRLRQSLVHGYQHGVILLYEAAVWDSAGKTEIEDEGFEAVWPKGTISSASVITRSRDAAQFSKVGITPPGKSSRWTFWVSKANSYVPVI